MPSKAPNVPGEGVQVYVKDAKSKSAVRLKNFTHNQGMDVTIHRWNDLCDLQIALSSLVEPSHTDVGKFTEEDFYVARQFIQKNSQIETLTFYRRGDEDGSFLNAFDDDLFHLGEVMGA